jgi:hypothetical protein
VKDYVYITKQWPLIKFKSLYSECIEYNEFKLRISSAYLVQPKKEPIVGQINYGSHLNTMALMQRKAHENSEGEEDDMDACDVGMVKCILSQECMPGK